MGMVSRFFFCFFIITAVAAAEDGGPRPAADAVKAFQVHKGFEVTLFAAEPDVTQPIAMTFDDRGRLWVVECFSFPDRVPGRDDRVLIFEDQDHDGRFDRRTVFWTGGVNCTGIELGFGGVWLTATPNLLFIPDKNGDDQPDGEPEVVLDGWDLKARHNKVNGLIWGPDGWLYGCNGILSNSKVGPPGTPDEKRTAMNCGVWRWHPVTKKFEVVATGTTNPWGIDFDQYGQLFITNCVIQHLWHVTHGSHFQRMFGQDFNPHYYQLMETCADHIHWAGGPWHESRGNQPTHSGHGGGHAHSGAMIYQGDNWPAEYRNHIFMCNIHGLRLNQDTLEPHGSSYVAKHREDFFITDDPWYRAVMVKQGPDGGVYVLDWSDTGECHDHLDVHRESGRIFKITYGKPRIDKGLEDLAKLSDADLIAKCEPHANSWYGAHARRLLHERAAAGTLQDVAALRSEAVAQLRTAGQKTSAVGDVAPSDRAALAALWRLNLTGGLTPPVIHEVLAHRRPLVRGWTIQLAIDRGAPSAELLARLTKLAADDPAALVRRYLASTLQRMPVAERWPIATALAQRSEDAGDTNLSLLLWYGLEPLVPLDRARATKLVATAQNPLVRQYLVRRIGSLATGQETVSTLTPLVDLIDTDERLDLRRDVLRGLIDAFTGRRAVDMPPNWPHAYHRLTLQLTGEPKQLATTLSLVFGDPQAVAELKRQLQDSQATTDERRQALAALLQKKDGELVTILHRLLAEPELCSPALLGLAQYDDAKTPQVILSHYGKMNEAQRRDAVATLSSRPVYALALLAAIEAKQIATADLSAFVVRQLTGFGQREIDERLEKVWGSVRPPDKDKKARIAQLKKELGPKQLKGADAKHGRLVFSKTCAGCHKLFDAGTKIGPDLTGSQRANLDYVLENLVDPNAVIGRDYQMTLIQTADGRVINGIVVVENDNAVTLQTPNDRIVVPQGEIELRKRSPLSMMPEELLTKLTPSDLRDLVAYLASPAQVPLPAGE